jgi:ubiquinone biosynthesis UbiH/UbiF/VisC/COQ6 family hydroxylase
VLERELAAAVRFAPHITELDSNAAAHDSSEVRATLTALCEGRNSPTRESLGIAFEQHDYGHRAIAARLTSTRAHQGIARQWFRSPDVLALLPFDTPQPEHSYALVWSLPNAAAQELLALDAAAFQKRLMEATGAQAGELTLASERAAWPLVQANAQAWCGPGWVLLGDAAHVVHPLAGQGLNLGLADVAALVEVIRQREPWRTLDDEKLLRRYARERAAPTWAMGQVTDGLLRLFSHDAPALRELRNRGLTLVNHISPLKRWLTARALNS